MDVTISADFHFKGFRNRINAFRADAVETSGYLVGALSELTAGVEGRHNEFEGRNLIFGMDIDGDTSTVILDGAGAIEMEGDGNIFTITGEGFIDGIVDDFENAVVKAPLEGIADVHIGAFADAFEALEFLNFRRIVDIIGCGHGKLIHGQFFLHICKNGPSIKENRMYFPQEI
jgi:hypothetical protein